MKEENTYTKTLAIIFIAFLIGVTGLNYFVKDKEFSESENRVLAKKPKFSFERLFNGRYTKKYEKYKVDQFVGKDFFMKVKSSTDLLIGKRDNNNVFLSKDGYLIEDFKPNSKDEIDYTLNSLNTFSNKYEDLNIYLSIIPNSVSILEEKLPKFAPIESQRTYINEFSSKLSENIKYIDTFTTLKNIDDKYIYYKTDHHWTSLGAYNSFLKIKDDMNLNSDTYYNVKKVSNDFNGTLSSKSGFRTNEKDSIEVYLPENNIDVVVNFLEAQKKKTSLYNTESLKTKDKYSLFLEGNHPLLEINTTKNTPKQLLLIKDSYANALVPFLTEYYSKIVIVDPRYYYEDLYELIDNSKFTDILFLYNANTFFTDTSLAPVINNE